MTGPPSKPDTAFIRDDGFACSGASIKTEILDHNVHTQPHDHDQPVSFDPHEQSFIRIDVLTGLGRAAGKRKISVRIVPGMDCGGSIPSSDTISMEESEEDSSWSRRSSQDVAGMETDDAIVAQKSVNGSMLNAPSLSHRLTHDKSILCLAVSRDYLFAGAHRGEILVFRLDTYQHLDTLVGHSSSVLGLCLSPDKRLLLSSSGDRTVNVWSTESLRLVHSIYSPYDTGDVFCVAYAPSLQVIYLGAQNTSIQWYDLREKESRPRPELRSHPSFRHNRFFDSSGPGGLRLPHQAAKERPRDTVGVPTLEIDRDYVHTFAHYGYVYCMQVTSGSLFGYTDEEVLISGGGDGAINIWRLDAADHGAIEFIGELSDGREEGHSILSMALDGNFLYSGRLGGEVNVWDLETKQLVRTVKAKVGDVMTLSVGGGFLFCGGTDGTIEKYNRQYEVAAKFQAHGKLILASVFASLDDKAIFVTGGNDSTVGIWDVSDCMTAPSQHNPTSKEQLVQSLRLFVAHKTVSSDPKYKLDCRRGASYLRSVFKSFGATSEMLTTENYNPVVFARFRGNPKTADKRKKILFYGHYDVIPADNAKRRWHKDPFTLSGMDGYLYGRGASDNKGPVMAAIYAIAELVTEKALESDIVFLIEGEEECGSRGFEEAVQANKELIGDIDWILLANSYWLDDGVPCLTYGLRGVVHASVQVESTHPDLHSGVDGSALLDEPLKDLNLLLAKLVGAKGRILLPGFYDPILPLTADEKQLYDDITQVLIQRNPELGDPQMLAQSLMKRWREASLTLHGFKTSGPDNSTIIPHRAKAALSLRLVPNQEAAQVAAMLTSFLNTEFAGFESQNHLTVTIEHQAEPWLGDFNNEIFKTLEEAIRDVWGPIYGRRRASRTVPRSKTSELRNTAEAKSRSPPNTSIASPTTSNTLAKSQTITESTESSVDSTDGNSPGAPRARKPLYIREGGSIPTIRFLEKAFNAPAAHLPIGQASDSAHLDNERLRLLNLYMGKDVFKRVFRDLPRK